MQMSGSFSPFLPLDCKEPMQELQRESMKYSLDFTPSDRIGEEGDQWLNTGSNTLYVKQGGTWVGPWDSDECGCGHPDARPPCSYCENGEYHMEGWDGSYVSPSEYMNYDTDWENNKIVRKALTSYDNNKDWKERCEELIERLAEIENGFHDKYYEEFKEKYHKVVREELEDDLYSSVVDEIIEKETAKIRAELYDKIDAQIREEIREEVRLEVLKDISKASDSI